MTAQKTGVRGRQGETAERALNIAEQLFAEQGFGGTTLKQVATELGIKEPSLYKHYGSKDALYQAVLSRGVQPVLEELEAIRTALATNLNPVNIPSRLIRLLSEHPNVARLLMRESSTGKAMHPIAMNVFSLLFERGQAVDQLWGKESKSNDRDSMLLPMAMMNITLGYFNCGQLFSELDGGDIGDPETLEKQCQLADRVYQGMLKMKL